MYARDTQTYGTYTHKCNSQTHARMYLELCLGFFEAATARSIGAFHDASVPLQDTSCHPSKEAQASQQVLHALGLDPMRDAGSMLLCCDMSQHVAKADAAFAHAVVAQRRRAAKAQDQVQPAGYTE